MCSCIETPQPCQVTTTPKASTTISKSSTTKPTTVPSTTKTSTMSTITTPSSTKVISTTTSSAISSITISSSTTSSGTTTASSYPACSAPPSYTSGGSTYTITCNNNLIGTDIKAFAGIATIQACIDKCAGMGDCVAVNFDRNAADENCFLLSEFTIGEPNPHVDSGYEQIPSGTSSSTVRSSTSTAAPTPCSEPATYSGYTITCNNNLLGTSAKGYSGIANIQACIDQCIAYGSDCVAVNFDTTASDQNCFLLSLYTAGEPNSHVISGMSPGSAPGSLPGKR